MTEARRPVMSPDRDPKAVEVTVGETVLESNIAALDMTKVAQGTAKTCQAPSCRWLRLTH
jgi:hypothetical protein